MFVYLLQQPSPAPALSLDAAVREALDSHRRLAAARQDTRAARFSVRAARALPNPQINFAPALDQFNGTTEELLVTQPLELNGIRTARTREAQAHLQATEASQRIHEREIVSAVKVAYIALWREREMHALTTALLETARHLHRLAQKQVELGDRPGIDLAQTALEASRAQRQETLALSRVRQAEAALGAALGRRPEAPAPEVALPRAAAQIPTIETALATAIAARTEVQHESALADARRQEAMRARAERRPDLAAQFRSQYVTFQTPRRSDYGFSLALRVPVDWGSLRNRIQQADAVTQAQEDRVELARQQIRQEVAQAIARLEGAVALVDSLAQALPDAERLLRAARIGFEEGKTPVLTALEAQRAYRETLGEQVEAQAELALAQAELARALGGTR